MNINQSVTSAAPATLPEFPHASRSSTPQPTQDCSSAPDDNSIPRAIYSNTRSSAQRIKQFIEQQQASRSTSSSPTTATTLDKEVSSQIGQEFQASSLNAEAFLTDLFRQLREISPQTQDAVFEAALAGLKEILQEMTTPSENAAQGTESTKADETAKPEDNRSDLPPVSSIVEKDAPPEAPQPAANTAKNNAALNMQPAQPKEKDATSVSSSEHEMLKLLQSYYQAAQDEEQGAIDQKLHDLLVNNAAALASRYDSKEKADIALSKMAQKRRWKRASLVALTELMSFSVPMIADSLGVSKIVPSDWKGSSQKLLFGGVVATPMIFVSTGMNRVIGNHFPSLKTGIPSADKHLPSPMKTAVVAILLSAAHTFAKNAGGRIAGPTVLSEPLKRDTVNIMDTLIDSLGSILVALFSDVHAQKRLYPNIKLHLSAQEKFPQLLTDSDKSTYGLKQFAQDGKAFGGGLLHAAKSPSTYITILDIMGWVYALLSTKDAAKHMFQSWYPEMSPDEMTKAEGALRGVISAFLMFFLTVNAPALWLLLQHQLDPRFFKLFSKKEAADFRPTGDDAGVRLGGTR